MCYDNDDHDNYNYEVSDDVLDNHNDDKFNNSNYKVTIVAGTRNNLWAKYTRQCCGGDFVKFDTKNL